VRNLEVRLEKLEQAIKPSADDALVVSIISFVGGGPIKAYRSSLDNRDFYVERLAGESEEDFAERAGAEARGKLTPTPWGVITLFTENERLPPVTAEPVSERKLDPAQQSVPVLPKGQPLPSPVPQIQVIRHWMA
jgi:hypothetical protein